MHICSPHKTGLIGAGLFVIDSLIWITLILLGLAQGFTDWILGLYMFSFSYTILPFSIVNAFLLLVVTGIIGYIVGYILGHIFSHCKGCHDGMCCMDEGMCYPGESMEDHHAHMMGDMMMVAPAKKKTTRKKKATPKKKTTTKKAPTKSKKKTTRKKK